MKTDLKTKKSCIVLVMMLILAGFSGASLIANIDNPDKPAKGDYLFPLEEVWQVDSAGDTPFGSILQLPVSDSGYVYVRDLKNKEYYIFDKNGKYVNAFGKHGEGPGEVKQVARASLALVGDKMLIVDADKILYFTQTGKFLRSVVNSAQSRPPVVWLNEDEFISAPRTILASADGSAQMKHVNLKTGKVKVITDFSLFKGGLVQSGNVQAVVVMPSITPVMAIGKHENNLYFGMNDKYEIYITNLEGKEVGGFTLKRERTTVTLKQKEKVMGDLVKGLAPPEVAKQLAKALPEQETYFSSIQSRGGMLYLYKSAFVPGNRRQVDIFSPQGKYLYRGLIKVKDGYTIVSGPTIQGNFITVALEDEEGEITVNKYKTVLPL
jgi:hypothetical protein